MPPADSPVRRYCGTAAAAAAAGRKAGTAHVRNAEQIVGCAGWFSGYCWSSEDSFVDCDDELTELFSYLDSILELDGFVAFTP
jgi:hypothetical protein